MATIETRPVLAASAAPAGSYLEWSPVIAGAAGAAALSFLLLTFGASIGLTLSSPWPNSGAPFWAIAAAVGWWAVMVQIGASFAGGYLAGRMRQRWHDSTLAESQFRDGAHGFLVWAVAILVSAWLVGSIGGAAVGSATQATATVAAGAASGNANAALSNSPADVVTGSLLRTSPRPAATIMTPGTAQNQTQTAATPNNDGVRTEIRRVYTTTLLKGEFTARDRDYLTDVVMERNNVSREDAQKRVDQSIEELKSLEVSARQQAEKARKIGIISGFLAASALLISMAAAVAGASLGGRHRDEGTVAHLMGHRFW